MYHYVMCCPPKIDNVSFLGGFFSHLFDAIGVKLRKYQEKTDVMSNPLNRFSKGCIFHAGQWEVALTVFHLSLVSHYIP